MASRPLILLVEDEDQVRSLEEHVLRDAGYAVHSVATARDARLHLRAYRYDLVLADAVLGDDSGIAVAEDAEAKGMRALILTGYGIQLQKALSRHEHLLKPIRPDELVRAVRLYLAAGKE
jgi:DNA-binding NtrC family response regulator